MFSVIFDMDGTLLDTQRICIPAWEYAGQNQGIKGVGEHIPNVCGMAEPTWTEYLVKNFPNMDIPKFKDEMRVYIIENLDVKFMKGAKELLDFLKQQGIKMALASGSSQKTIQHHLKAVNAEQYFSVALGGEDVKNGKPDPEIFLTAAKKINADPKDCFVIEDSDNGIIAGSKAGMKCIGVPDVKPFYNSTKKLMYANANSLFDVLEIFKKELKK